MKFNSNADIVMLNLKKMGERVKSPAKVLKRISMDMKKEVGLRFKTATDPEGNPWKELAESTRKRRRGDGEGATPLSDTGRLRRSVTAYSDNNQALAGTNVKYAKVQNYGAKKGEFGAYDVEQNVGSFTRTRNGRSEEVRTHKRARKIETPWGEIPNRRFIGFNDAQKKKYIKWITESISGKSN